LLAELFSAPGANGKGGSGVWLFAIRASLPWATPAFVAHVLLGESSPFGRPVGRAGTIASPGLSGNFPDESILGCDPARIRVSSDKARVMVDSSVS